MTEAVSNAISRRHIDAVIFDLDGVITDTASLHAFAWQQTFDPLLRKLSGEGEFVPFDVVADYLAHVDGRPRFDGVRAFLAARGYQLPEGTPDDGPEQVTVHGIGNLKRDRYLQMVREQGVKVFSTSVHMLRRLRSLGYRTAVVTGSRNANLVLEQSGLKQLFDQQVDGEDVARLGLAGKPAPDAFLHAAKLLGVPPERIVVVEDALAGVAAGRAGGFGMVIAVARASADAAAYFEQGADVVVSDLAEMPVAEIVGEEPAAALPRASLAMDELRQRLQRQPPLILLDYDGTLSPIVERPEQAVLPDSMRSALAELTQLCPVAVVSGRDLPVVRELVGLSGMAYAGCHGFDMVDAHGKAHELAAASRYLPLLDRLEARLRPALENIEGAQLERKRFSIAVHSRRVKPDQKPHLEKILGALKQAFHALKTTPGKEVVEFLPALDWDKGRAVEWLVQELDPKAERYPIYIGDDVTDENAFRVLRGIGLGILVRDNVERVTAARYALADTVEVEGFLRQIAASVRE